MFSFFRSDPTQKLKKQYHEKLKNAMKMQRNGNIRRYSELTEEAETLKEKIEEIENKY